MQDDNDYEHGGCVNTVIAVVVAVIIAMIILAAAVNSGQWPPISF